MPPSTLRFSKVSKAYYGNRVLTDVDLELRAGEIHALIGENGAGKSTLMNILFGMPVIRETGGYSGRVLLDDEEVRFQRPADAMGRGIGMVHQEFMLLPGLTVAENVKLNREPLRHWALGRATRRKLDFVDRVRMGREARASLDRVGLSVNEWRLVEGLPVGHMQLVEIAREIDKKRSRFVVFDEPTAVLTEEEAGHLIEIMRTLAGEGVGILFITHRLDEVALLADRVTVLRDGQVVQCLRSGEADTARLAELMVGRPVGLRATGERNPGDERALLEVEDLAVEMPGEEVRGIDLTIRRGEIVGIGGLAGHGKLGIANGIMGLHPATGSMRMDGEPLPLGNTAAAIDRGLAFVSEDRRKVGLLLDSSIEMNISATAVSAKGRFLAGPALLGPLRPLSRSEVRRYAESSIGALDIRCTGPDQPVRRLSGGNQQKVCFARAMALEPRLLLVSEPTRGVDVGAKELILETLLELRESGVTILMCSSELGELRSVCDRILIVYKGRLAAELGPGDSDRRFGLAMSGETEVPA